jgi:hypothetical protein
MSYEIASSFSVDEKKMEMKGSFASSNVHPRTFDKHVWTAPKDKYQELPSVKTGVITPEDVFKISIVRDLVGGNVQLASTTSVKFRYALLQLQKKLKEDGFEFWQKGNLLYEKTYSEYTFHDILHHQCSDAEYKELLSQLKRYADFFFDLKNAVPEKGEFVVQILSGYLKKLNKNSYTYCYTPQYAKKFPNRWEAELASVNIKGRVFKLEEVE